MSDDLNKKLTKIIPLGGIEEIGKNMTIIEHDDEIFIVDCGIKFADENVLFGVNAIICPFDYLIANEHKIVGLFVTHAHEDHIGGIPYLLKSINIPKIYGFKLTTLIIAKKLREHKDLKTYEFEVIDDNSEIKTKHFKINFYRVCHSIPDCFGLFIETPNGKVVHTGDFRFDLLAQGDETDILKIAEIGRKDIDLLLCETTNSETRGFSSSEKNVVDELRRIISKAKGRVFLTTFASQLSRIEEVIEIAISNNRKIALCGRSLETNIEMAIKANYLNISKNSFIEPREVKNEKPNEVIILLTGSQGEEMAALSQIAVGKHP
jgi:ribonuclease J